MGNQRDRLDVAYLLPQTSKNGRNALSELIARLESVSFSESPLKGICIQLTRDYARLNAFMNETHVRLMDKADLLCLHNIYIGAHALTAFPELATSRIALMTHSPSFRVHEDILTLCPQLPPSVLHADPCVKLLVNFELSVMRTLYGIIWPCPESQEGYPGWDRRFGAPCREAYARSCVPQPIADGPALNLRQLWNIRPDQQLVLFLGRPHQHKGYQFFVELSHRAILENCRELVFVHGGAPPHHMSQLESIRYVGFVTDRAAAYCAADINVFPNELAYLDLGLLEALSLGCRIALRAKGAHKIVLPMCPGIPVLDDDIDKAWSTLLECLDRNQTDREQRECYVRVWKESFSLPHFVRYHLQAFRNLTDPPAGDRRSIV